jgi:hypothetical protein
LPVIPPRSPQLCQNGGLSVLSSIKETERSRVDGGWQSCCEMVCCDATASPFVAKVRVKVFTHFHAITIKRHSSMCNWLFGLPGWIFCERSPWCQRKLWPCPWLYSSPVLPFSVCPWAMLYSGLISGTLLWLPLLSNSF